MVELSKTASELVFLLKERMIDKENAIGVMLELMQQKEQAEEKYAKCLNG